MQQRLLGKTGVSLSMVGFGGIVVMNEEPAAAADIVARAVERGVNYFDVAPSYGNAEERLGPALAPYRKQVFLACKTTRWDRVGAAEDMQASFRKLHTDYFDLYQLHGVTTLADVEQIFAPGGAMETVLAARDAGQVRFIGFSAHSEEAALAMLERFPFDTVLFPINWVSWYQGHFGMRVVEKVSELGIGLLALKTLGKRAWAEGEKRTWPKCWYCPVDTLDEAIPAVRFTFSRPVTAGPSPSHQELLWLFCDAMEHFSPLSQAEEDEIARKSEGLTPFFHHKKYAVSG